MTLSNSMNYPGLKRSETFSRILDRVEKSPVLAKKMRNLDNLALIQHFNFSFQSKERKIALSLEANSSQTLYSELNQIQL